MPIYFKLFHGRKTLDEEMDGWGSDGPCFGPLSFAHTTYAGVVHLGEPGSPWNTIGDLTVVDACIYYDGVYYGDWSAFGEENLDDYLRGLIVPFCEYKASPSNIRDHQERTLP